MTMGKVLAGIVLISVLLAGCRDSVPGELIVVEPQEGEGFNYPYFLFLPERLLNDPGAGEALFLLVEPNNSGFADDDLDAHAEKAGRQATRDFYVGNFMATALGYPLLVPVFPRPESEWKIYTHALDRDAIREKGTSLERLDLQLLAMVEDARRLLAEREIPTKHKILLTGFSASGTFVNRFSLIHPDRIAGLAAGGVNGLLMLPVGELNGNVLGYPLGIHDFGSLFGKAFDSLSFRAVPQFLYMWENDTNDAVPYEDGYDKDERETVYATMGERMMPDRWNKCTGLYGEKGINARFRSYPGTGHENPDHVKQEILEFFKDVTAQPPSPG